MEECYVTFYYGTACISGRVKDGEILFNGEDLLKKKKSEMRKIQGDHIAYDFPGSDDIIESII